MSMQAMMSLPTKTFTAAPLAAKPSDDTISTRVWLDEYTFLQSIYHSAGNCSPKFRLPDLISACVSQVFLGSDPAGRIFGYLHTERILRDQNSVRLQIAIPIRNSSWTILRPPALPW